MTSREHSEDKRVRINLTPETKKQVTRLQVFRREAGMKLEEAFLETIVADAIDLLYKDTFGV